MTLLKPAWNSLHARLLLGAVVWVAVALAMSDFAISALFRQYVTGQFLHELIDHTGELVGLTHLDPATGKVQLWRPLSDPRFEVPGSGFFWEIKDDGRPLMKSGSLGDDGLVFTAGSPSPDPHPGRMMRSSTPILMIERDLAVPGHKLRLGVATDTAQLETVLRGFAGLLRLSLGILAVGLIAASLAQVAFALLPIHRLHRRLAEIRRGQSTRLPQDFPTEVRPLVDELNGLIDANEDMIRRARAQAGNLAHALKSPLAILIDEAEALRREGNARAAAVVLQQCRAMGRQIDHQLARARAAAAGGALASRARPYAVAGTIFAAMTRLHAGKGLTFENDLAAELEVACDEDDLNEIMGNLIDNAAKWGATKVRIGSEPSANEDFVRLVVDDDGPGIAPENYEAVFGVGERLDEKTPGSGLGLAIVKDIAGLYGGRAVLAPSPLGGLSATVELPKA